MGLSRDFGNLVVNIVCCSLNLKCMRDYIKHKYANHNIAPHHCPICETFEGRKINYEHRRECIKIKMAPSFVGQRAVYMKCEIENVCCDIKFSKLDDLVEHLKVSHTTDTILGKCVMCNDFDESARVIDYDHRLECYRANFEIRNCGQRVEYERIQINRECCDKKFTNVKLYEEHLREVHIEKFPKSECFICKKKDESRGIDYNHRIDCAKSKFCKRTKDGDLNMERYRKMKFTFECCGKVYKKSLWLEHHRRNVHSEDLIWNYDKCFMCDVDESESIDYTHRIDCLYKFLRSEHHVQQNLALDTKHNVFIDQTKSVSAELDRAHMYLNCEECHEWLQEPMEYPRLFEDELPELFYDDMQETFPPGITLLNNIKFDDKCGIDARCLTLFDLRDVTGYQFFHISVRYLVWSSFLERIENMNIFFTRYYCVCNGGRTKDLKKFHRHMLIATNENINDITRGLKDDNGKGVRYASFGLHIKTYKRLVNTVHYLTHEQSQCKLEDSKKESKRDVYSSRKRRRGGNGKNHFFIGTSVIPHGTLATSFFNVCGIQAVCDIMFGSLSVTDTLKYIVGIEHMHSVKLSDLNTLKNHAIPLKYNLRHSMVYTDMRLELGPSACNTGNIVRCFAECPDAIDPGNDFEKYNRYAMSIGAMMFNVAMNSIYKLSDSQREVLKRVGQMAREQTELKEQVAKQAEHIVALQQQNAIIVDQMQVMQTEHIEILGNYDTIIGTFKGVLENRL